MNIEGTKRGDNNLSPILSNAVVVDEITIIAEYNIVKINAGPIGVMLGSSFPRFFIKKYAVIIAIKKIRIKTNNCCVFISTGKYHFKTVLKNKIMFSDKV